MIYNNIRLVLVTASLSASSGMSTQPLDDHHRREVVSAPHRMLSSVQYKAAVVQSANGYDLKHVYVSAAKAKSDDGAEIIVFPENGLTGGGDNVAEWGYSTVPQGNGCNDENSPACTTWPKADSTKSLASDCAAAVAALTNDEPIEDVVRTAACIAQTVGMYIVFNVGDEQECLKDGNGNIIQASCPAAGKVAFNTEVAFNPAGALVAKYYKHFLFNDAKTQPSQLILQQMDTVYGTAGTFTANFAGGDVKFGLAVCNDINSAVLIEGYVENGVKDIIVSDNWHNSFSLESITSITNGFSRTYGISMLVASAGDGAGGSGIFTNGETLASGPLLIMDLGDYKCIDITTGTFGNKANCVGDISTATVASGGAVPAYDPVVKVSGEAWPRPALFPNTMQGLGLPIPEIVAVVARQGIQPAEWLDAGSTFKDVQAAPASMMVNQLQNVGNVDMLTSKDMVAGGVYHFESENNGVKCEVTATVKTPGQADAFKLLTVNSDVYMPDVPCPFQWNVCSLSRCVKSDGTAGADDWKMCRAGPVASGNLDQLTQFSNISITMTTNQGSIVSPLIVGNQLQPLDSSKATMTGDWGQVQKPGADMLYQLTLTEETMGADGFGFATILGNNAASPYEKCNECVNPDDLWDIKSAHITNEDTRQAVCTMHYWGSGGPGNYPPPPPMPSSSSGLSNGAIAAIVLGACAGATILAALAYYGVKAYKSQSEKYPEAPAKQSAGADSGI